VIQVSDSKVSGVIGLSAGIVICGVSHSEEGTKKVTICTPDLSDCHEEEFKGESLVASAELDNLVVFADDTNLIKLYDKSEDGHITSPRGFEVEGQVISLLLDPEHKYLICGERNGILEIFTLDTEEEVSRVGLNDKLLQGEDVSSLAYAYLKQEGDDHHFLASTNKGVSLISFKMSEETD